MPNRERHRCRLPAASAVAAQADPANAKTTAAVAQWQRAALIPEAVFRSIPTNG